jgi:hypothetical protein
MTDFYIVSLKHTRREHLYITFWRPSDAGYSYPLSWSGKYSEAAVMADLGYYNSGHSTIAVPCSVVDQLGESPEPGQIDNDAGPVVRNTAEHWNVLIANVIQPPLRPAQPQYKGAPKYKEAA